jgi:hypothetical protein
MHPAFLSPSGVPVIVPAEPIFAVVCYSDYLFLRFQIEMKIFFPFLAGWLKKTRTNAFILMLIGIIDWFLWL